MRSWTRPASALVILALLASACGSSKKSSSTANTTATTTATTAPSGSAAGVSISRSTATQPATWTGPPINASTLKCNGKAPDPTRGITATSIKVGGITTLSNAGTSTYQDTVKGAKARFDRENANGGVFGRKIDFIGGLDDANNAQQNADAGRKLAENEKVFAVAPITTSLPNYADALCTNVVPAFGWAFNTGMCERANTFGFTGCLLSGDAYKSNFGVGNFLELLKDSSDKSIALVGVDNASGIQGVQNTKTAYQKAGLNVVKTTNQFVQGQPPADPSPFVRDIMTSNNGKPPAMVYHITDFTNVASLTQALTAAGYKGIQISAVGYDPRLAGFKGLDNTYVSLQWLPSEATDNPVVKQMTSDIQQYGQGAPLALTTTAGWLSADMLIAGLKATGKDLTVDNFLKAMNSGSFHYGDGIYSGVTTWPENHYYGTPCGTATHLSGGKYTLTVPLVCNGPIK